MTDPSYLPGDLAARLEQALPELRYVARQLAVFYAELIARGVPEAAAAKLTREVMRQVSEDLKGGGE